MCESVCVSESVCLCACVCGLKSKESATKTAH